MADRFLTPLQRRRIQQAIRDGHLAFLAEMFGPTAIDHEDYERLRAAGKIRDEKLLPQDAAVAAHMLGVVVGDTQASALNAMRMETSREDAARIHDMPASAVAREFGVDKPALVSTDSFWRRLRDDPQVVTEAEREAVALLRDRIGQHVRGLGNKFESTAGHILVDADDKLRRRRLTKLQTAVISGAEERTTAQDVAQRIRDATKDFKRDWFRVAHTELHNATEEAKAIVIAHRGPERDPRVFKRPHASACSFCVLLYLKPDKVTPRIFRLSALLANGSNVGRRAGRPTRSGRSRTEWKAVVGAIHPLCQCELHVFPDGMGFNERGEMVYVGVKKSMTIEVDKPNETLFDHVCQE